ncbi:MAG: histidinol-phosphatase [Clostridia bacterium]|nr:histidinol-phosphatase [Clostridia bacterium]
MEPLITANYHTHSKYCRHASGETEDYANAAVEAGLSTLGFSDHTPYPFPDGYYSNFRMFPGEMKDYIADVLRCKERFSDKLDIRLGYEVEYYPRHFGALVKTLAASGCDYLILGQHFTKNEYDGEYSGDMSDSVQKLKTYVDQVSEALETGLFSCLCHPELIHFAGPDEIYEEQMTRLVETAVKTDTPLEINLRGLKFHAQYPDELFMDIAAPLGAEFIIGVDAHDPRDLLPGKEYEQALELAKKHGLCLIDRMNLKKPVV